MPLVFKELGTHLRSFFLLKNEAVIVVCNLDKTVLCSVMGRRRNVKQADLVFLKSSSRHNYYHHLGYLSLHTVSVEKWHFTGTPTSIKIGFTDPSSQVVIRGSKYLENLENPFEVSSIVKHKR